jgi:hypothetical protein
MKGPSCRFQPRWGIPPAPIKACSGCRGFQTQAEDPPVAMTVRTLAPQYYEVRPGSGLDTIRGFLTPLMQVSNNVQNQGSL